MSMNVVCCFERKTYIPSAWKRSDRENIWA